MEHRAFLSALQSLVSRFRSRLHFHSLILSAPLAVHCRKLSGSTKTEALVSMKEAVEANGRPIVELSTTSKLNARPSTSPNTSAHFWPAYSRALTSCIA